MLVLQMQAWFVNDLAIFSFECVVQMKPKLEKQKLSYYNGLFKFPPQLMI